MIISAVVQTYRRFHILAKLLKDIDGTPFLNKIVVVWNDITNLSTVSVAKWPNLTTHLQVCILLT